MTHDAARRLSRPDRLADIAVRRHRPASLEPLLKAALDSTLPGLILLDTGKRVRLVTRGAAAMLGLPDAGQDPGHADHAATGEKFLARPTLPAGFGSGVDSDQAAPRKIMLTLPNPAGTRIVAVDICPLRTEGFAIRLTDVNSSRETQDFLLDQASCDP